MKARHLLIGAMWLNLLAVTATAETMIVRPDPCPAPADAPKIIMLSKVEAADLNPGRAAARDVLVLYPVRARGWASARILARFEIEDDSKRQLTPKFCVHRHPPN
jgi:hypothetical protein